MNLALKFAPVELMTVAGSVVTVGGEAQAGAEVQKKIEKRSSK